MTTSITKSIVWNILAFLLLLIGGAYTYRELGGWQVFHTAITLCNMLAIILHFVVKYKI